MRNGRELLTISTVLDYIMVGDIHAATDVLVQRFKAIESATHDSSWSVARHLELVPEIRVSTVSDRERELAIRQEAQQQKLRTLTPKGSLKGGGKG